MTNKQRESANTASAKHIAEFDQIARKLTFISRNIDKGESMSKASLAAQPQKESVKHTDYFMTDYFMTEDMLEGNVKDGRFVFKNKRGDVVVLKRKPTRRAVLPYDLLV